jgi:hypothetical protein
MRGYGSSTFAYSDYAKVRNVNKDISWLLGDSGYCVLVTLSG